MISEELKEIEDRCNKVAPFEIGFSKKTGRFVSFFDGIGVVDLDEGEIDFIIHSRDDILTLLAHIKELESRLPRWILAADISPPEDGTHILVCRGRYDKGWTFMEGPPVVVHFFEGSMGFELSMGADENSSPVEFTHWQPLPREPEE